MRDVAAGYQLQVLRVNGIEMRVAEQGDGPLVLLLHGAPESWYSWRHQLPALANAGFRAVAPDMRGYGGTAAPPAVEDYAIDLLCGDVTGLIDAYGEERAVLVGHDWGAAVAWQCTLIAEERVRAVVVLSKIGSWLASTSRHQTPQPPTEVLRQAYGEDFFYQLYFQEPGVAERELDADPRQILQRLFASRNAPREPPEITDPAASAGGWVGRIGRPTELPPWLTAEELDYYVRQFEVSGFRGMLNYYRNLDRNWELMADVDQEIEQPALYMAGDKDGVVRGQGVPIPEVVTDRPEVAARLTEMIAPRATDFRGVHLIPDGGHWINQERPEEVNRLLLEFLRGLP